MREPNTGYYARVIADSVNPHGSRLTTLEVCFPRFILAEFNTHRAFSRNSASSRAIPVSKQLERIEKFPFVPAHFPINQPGMSASTFLRPGDAGYNKARDTWLLARDAAVRAVEMLLEQDIHKQIANRLLEPFMWHTVVCSATEWENFFNLRISPLAQPEIEVIASLMKHEYDKSEPETLNYGELHLPYVDPLEWPKYNGFQLMEISAGRCAAVTLLNHQIKSAEKDITRCDKLVDNGHMTPLEHPAEATRHDFDDSKTRSNFNPTWRQFRKFIPNEAVFTGGKG